MKQMKKLLSLLLVLTLVFGVCGGLLLTARADGTYNGFDYEENSDGVAIMDYSGSDTTITVPAEINGKPVNRIGNGAFAYFYDVKEITLPDTVTSIGSMAFASSTFRTINLGKGVQSIGDFAFQDCYNLEHLILGDELVNIGSNAFHNAGTITDNGFTLYVTENNLDYTRGQVTHTVQIGSYEPLVTCGKTTYVKILDDGNLTAETISCEIGEGYEAIVSEDADLTIDLGMEVASLSPSLFMFQIGTYAQLRRFSVYENFVDPSACAQLCQDIVAEDDAWLPIGSVCPFEGDFYGFSLSDSGKNPKYYTITGLSSAQTPDAYRGALGLFGNIASGGVVAGVGLCNTTFISDEADARVAGIAAVNNGTVDSCYCFGTTALWSTGANGYVGGIVGDNTGNIERCFVTGYATIEGSATSAAGGLVGVLQGSLKNSYYAASGSIRGSYAGGLAGDASSGVMEDCFSYVAATIRNIENDSSFTVSTVRAGLIAGYIGGRLSGEGVFYDDDLDPNRPVGYGYWPGFIQSVSFSNLQNAQATFKSSFDFRDTWYMGEKYPELQIARDCVPEGWNTGDVIQYGNYPQSEVAETDALKAAADAAAWKSFGDYSGDSDDYSGYYIAGTTMAPGDFFQYADFVQDGVQYRAIRFTEYRPFMSCQIRKEDYSNQPSNGYAPNTVYYFKYEPIAWRVLDPAAGLVMCDTVLDSRAFQNFITKIGDQFYGDAGGSAYATDWAHSELRAWLNQDFYQTAFTAAQQANIRETTLSTVGYNEQANIVLPDSTETVDRVFLLSYDDAMNPGYGFVVNLDEAKRIEGSDYAKARGLYYIDNGGFAADDVHAFWNLRTAYSTQRVYTIYPTGFVNNIDVSSTDQGVVPAMVLNEIRNDTEVAPYHEDDVILYGSYPQSRVTDAATIAALEETFVNEGLTENVYIYYASYDDSEIPFLQGEMFYCDMLYNGAKYRRVDIERCRPRDTRLTIDLNNSYQDENGYLSYYDDAHYPTGSGVYWFRYEPLRWRVLDPDTGLVMCETIIDSQPFNEFALTDGADVYGAPLVWGNMGQNYYASDYRRSSIRAWLNHDFMYTAFTEAQRDGIAETTLDNSLGKVYEDRPLSETIYDYQSTTDSVYLLSLEDARNDAYDFTQPVRGSDYAKCQGLGVSADGSSDWLLRTAAETSDALWYVGADGKAAHAVQTTNTSLGIRPVMTLKELKNDAAIDTRIAPSIVICIDDVTYNRKAVAVITVSDDANGMVSVTVEGSGTETYTYEGAVSYGVASVDLTDLPPDFYIATVNFYSGEYVDDAESPTGKTFVRDDLFAPSVGVAAFSVKGLEVEISSAIPEGILFDSMPFNISTSLFDEAAFERMGLEPPVDTLFANGSAILYIDGEQYATKSGFSNVAHFGVAGLSAGSHAVKVEYLGDAFHQPAVDEFELNVENPTALKSFVLECADYRVGETAEFRAELPLDAMGTVTFTISAIREGGSVVVKEIENVPLEDGVAKASTAELPAGEYQVIAAYNGYNYTAGTAQGDFTITLHQSYITIALEKDHVSVGESAVVSIEIPENAGVDPRSAGNVSVLLNGAEMQTITVENGVGQYTIPPLEANTYTITAVFNGDAQYYYASTSDPLTLVVENNATSIALAVTPEDVIEYGDTVTVTATLSGDKDPTFVADTQVPAGGNDTGVAGGVTITVDGKAYYTVAAQTGDPVIALSGNVATLALTGLTAGDHTVKVVYRGDAANIGSEAETTFKVEKGKPAIDVTYTPANEEMTAIQLTITKPLDAVDGVSVEVLHAEYKSSTTSIDANQFENGRYVLSFPECFGDLYKKPGIYKFIVTYYGETDPNYTVGDQELWVTLNCAHEWKEPVWNWEDDVHNPSYSAECNNCTEKAEGSVASRPGARVEATLNDDAYTPYTAQVTLGTQTFNSSFKKYEPGTMHEARAKALEDYKETLISAANGKALAGDSEKAAALIAATVDAINGVTYDPDRSLEDNYAAADAAADLDALDAALADQRAADAVEAKINAIGEVEYTPECKAKIDDAVGARDALTPDQLGLLSDDAAVTLRNAIKAYQQLEDAVSFDDYKEAKKAEADAKALEGDSEKAAALITAAKKAIDDVTYNENISLDENKQAVDTAANLAGLDAALADQRAADAAEKAISDIGEVEYTDESKRRIDAARAAYDDLTDTQKTLVENIDTLTDAEADYALLESKAAFEDYKDAVKAAADALGQAGDSAQSAALIENAKKAVDDLAYDESKSLDENKQAVDDAANLQQLTAGLDNQRAADAVEALIDEIGDVALTDESKGKIDAARAAYDALTPEQQALVENPDVLTAAEQEYDDRQAFEDYKDEVINAAEDKALDDDSDESSALIDAVKDAVNAMTYDDTKPLAENKQAVDTAANLPQLDKDLTDQRASDAAERAIDAIGDVALTDESKEKIDAARETYDALTDEQKAKVDNLDVLTAAEQEYADREAFEEYKEEKKAELDALAKEGDSSAAQQIIEDAKAEIDAMEYDDIKSLEENKKDADAVVADTEKTIENQRTADCPLCGKGHENGFFDKLLGIFHKVLYYINRYGCIAINIICQIIMKL